MKKTREERLNWLIRHGRKFGLYPWRYLLRWPLNKGRIRRLLDYIEEGASPVMDSSRPAADDSEDVGVDENEEERRRFFHDWFPLHDTCVNAEDLAETPYGLLQLLHNSVFKHISTFLLVNRELITDLSHSPRIFNRQCLSTVNPESPRCTLVDWHAAGAHTKIILGFSEGIALIQTQMLIDELALNILNQILSDADGDSEDGSIDE